MMARFIDLGIIPPNMIYQVCQGLPESFLTQPTIVWFKSEKPHLSLGATQNIGAEVDLQTLETLGIEVYQRVLGGGLVLVDQNQWAFFIFYPNYVSAPSLFHHRCLSVLKEVYHIAGLPVEIVGHDLWLYDKKILGSGSGTIEKCIVFSASFLLDFNPQLFVQYITAPSHRFRLLVQKALYDGMTAWSKHTTIPPEGQLQQQFCQVLEKYFSFDISIDYLTEIEKYHIVSTQLELPDLSIKGKKRIPHGLKINHQSYIFEKHIDNDHLRLLVQKQKVTIIEGSIAESYALNSLKNSLLEDFKAYLPHIALTDIWRITIEAFIAAIDKEQREDV